MEFYQKKTHSLQRNYVQIIPILNVVVEYPNGTKLQNISLATAFLEGNPFTHKLYQKVYYTTVG